MTPVINNAAPQGGFEISMTDERTYTYDGAMKKLADEPKKAIASLPRIVSTYDSLFVGDHVLGVASARMAPGKFRSGFFRAPTADPSRIELLKDVPSIDYYVLDNKYLAGVAGRDFGILMTEHPMILEF